ncbi:hypothetical protein NEFER03_2160 [Nematocida sp. LUAm3]|nr:hypothetical protein NEFER03_2160 [Nematocida sp. LUAm3]KAI5174631.1 hypothetical protein NEFER02_0752 [Nematocida sp. LUAm2]KAI5177963.1 hypothetical protein NEFER01_1145 [Nematocida sp. LUAm1]
MDRIDEEIFNTYARKRMQELQKNLSLREITDEALLIKKTKESTLLVHFYDPNFPRCKEMTRALEELAPKYPSIEFLNARAINFPFITEKLEVTQLPYLASFTKSFFIGGIIGFQDIGEDSLDVNLLKAYIDHSDLLETSPRQENQSPDTRHR